METTSTLVIGPIVGHTDSASSRIWIHVEGSLDGWQLNVAGVGIRRFVPTDAASNEFGTAIAIADGLTPDTTYRYTVDYRGAAQREGSFRTMPPDGSDADISFVTLSCDDDREPNAWQRLADLCAEDRPRFILMVGDQIYTDEGEEDLWKLHLDSPSTLRRRAIAAKHEKLWATEPIATIMANTPCYMTWDDHDIRDGWGSFAADSPTLAALYPVAEPIHQRFRAFFNDAADVYYHFQACRNPGEAAGGSNARPYAFRCGKLLVVVTDSRGERDFARPDCPILGPEQWEFIDGLLAEIDPGIDAIAVVTAVPIVDLDPDGKVHRFFEDRTDDIDLLMEGDAQGIDDLLYRRDNPVAGFASLIAGVTVDRNFRVAKALGFRVTDLDDMRDKWSYVSNRGEQLRLLTAFARACTQGREPGRPRSLVFLGGDIHVGAIFSIDMTDPPLQAQCVITSGIAKNAPIPEVKGVLVDESFEVSPGIHATLDLVINKVNFAQTAITFAASTPTLRHTIITPEEEEEPKAE